VLALVSLSHEFQPWLAAVRPEPGSHSALSPGFPPAVGNFVSNVNVLSSVHCAIPSVCFEETALLPALLEEISPFLPAVSSVLLLDLDGPSTTQKISHWTWTNGHQLITFIWYYSQILSWMASTMPLQLFPSRYTSHLRFYIFMLVHTKTMVFWNVTIHSLVKRYECFLLHGKEEDSVWYGESR